MNDITVGLSYMINNIIGLFWNLYYILDSVIFFGISLLDFNIAVMLISVIFPIIITVVKNNQPKSNARPKNKSNNTGKGKKKGEN